MQTQKRVFGGGSVQFGCDPEFFFRGPNNEIVAADKIIPKEGLHRINEKYPIGCMARIIQRKVAIIDGVQGEMNPLPAGCRQALGGNIGIVFQTLRDHLTKLKNGVKICFDPVIELTAEDMDNLSPEMRVLGCAPSLNFYDKDAGVGVEGANYFKRSAGGHIHIGIHGNELALHREELVPLLDIFVGNTCVMVDRDPNAAERRKVYGRAGEYRLPDHGLEYRVLSNFWLRHYQLMSMVMGLTRLASGVLEYSLNNARQKRPPKPYGYTDAQYDQSYPPSYYAGPELYCFDKDILSRVDLDRVRRAINENDLQLAKSNWKIVRQFIEEHTTAQSGGGSHALDAGTTEAFEYFCYRIQKEGFDAWFKGEPVNEWIMTSKVYGFESYLSQTVAPAMRAAKWKSTEQVDEFPVQEVVTLGEVNNGASVSEQPISEVKNVVRDQRGRFVKKAA